MRASSIVLQKFLVLALVVLPIPQALGVSPAISISDPASQPTEVSQPMWKETSLTRIIVNSTADWGRILFDDLNGTNSNGIRIRTVVDSGWLLGKESDEQIFAGRKIAWPDTEYDRVVARKGDMVAFFKGLGDFHPTVAYADLILEINLDLPRVYVWLMTGGNGTTSFEIVSQDKGGTIWRDIMVATGETQQVKRVMSPQTFFRPGRTETTVVMIWLSIVILAILVLNFPVPEAIRALLRRKRGSREPQRRDERGKHESARQGDTGPK